MRVVEVWDRRTFTQGLELTSHLARVSAAELPLGMVTAVAKAAQVLMDAALENKGEEAITAAVRDLRTAFYGNSADSGSPQ